MENSMQLAFEQYISESGIYGGTYRTLRYKIVDQNMFSLHDVLNPLTTGPALAAPVTQPGPQYPNAQTQGSAYQMPYASQPSQHMTPANTAQTFILQPRQLDPRASAFRVGSSSNNPGASARPSALPTANSALTYTPGLPVTQLSRSAPSNAHRSFLAPDHDWQRSRNNREAATAVAAPLMLNRPNSAPARPFGQSFTQQPQSAPSKVRPGHYGQPFSGSYDPYAAPREAAEFVAGPNRGNPSNTPIRLTHGPRVSQQPQQLQSAPYNPRREGLTLNTRLGPSDNDYGDAIEVPACPPALDHSYWAASRESWMAIPSPLDLNAVSSSETNNPHRSPQQESRHASEHSSDVSPNSSSVQDYSTYHRANPVRSDHIFSHSKAKPTNNASHGPQNGEIDLGIVPSPPAPAGQLQPRAGIDAILAYRVQQDWRPSTTNGDERHPSDPLNELSISPFEKFYNSYYKNWLKTAPPGSDIVDFAIYFESLVDPTQMDSDELAPDTTPLQRFQDTPTPTVSDYAGSSTVRNGVNPSREVARSATPTPTRLADGVSPRTDIPLQMRPRPQLQNGNNDRSEPDSNSHFYTRPTIQTWLEVQHPLAAWQLGEQWLIQRHNQYILESDAAYEEILTMRAEAGESSE